jgi:large subunit ribosomal protein L21
MYAIVEVGGRQHMMEPEKVVKVDRRPQEAGEEITLDKVLAIKNDDGELQVGRPYLEDTTVKARIVEQGRERKITVMKFKAKKRYRRKIGHRQHFTALEILSIDSESVATEMPAEAEDVEPQTEAEEPEAETPETETAQSSAATGVDTDGS